MPSLPLNFCGDIKISQSDKTSKSKVNKVKEAFAPYRKGIEDKNWPVTVEYDIGDSCEDCDHLTVRNNVDIDSEMIYRRKLLNVAGPYIESTKRFVERGMKIVSKMAVRHKGEDLSALDKYRKPLAKGFSIEIDDLVDQYIRHKKGKAPGTDMTGLKAEAQKAVLEKAKRIESALEPYKDMLNSRKHDLSISYTGDGEWTFNDGFLVYVGGDKGFKMLHRRQIGFNLFGPNIESVEGLVGRGMKLTQKMMDKYYPE